MSEEIPPTKYVIRSRSLACRAEKHDSCTVGPYGSLTTLCFCECHDGLLGDFEERHLAEIERQAQREEFINRAESAAAGPVQRHSGRGRKQRK